MAFNNNLPYDPLPLTRDDSLPSQRLYNAPPSPQPRFMAAALYDGPQPGPGLRDSFASSQHSLTSPHQGSEYHSSIYALNDSGPQRTYRDDPRGNYYTGDHGPGSVPMSPIGPSPGRALGNKHQVYAAPRQKSRRIWFVLAVIAGLLLVIAAVVVPVYLFVIRPKSNAGSSSSSNNNNPTSSHSPAGAPKPTSTGVTGGDRSTVTLEDGSTFTYTNTFGGFWYWDQNDPLNNGAKAQSWSPALNETFHYGTDKIRGVNLGGWLNTEPFISPALYQKYASNPTPPVDEWTLSLAMRADTAGGGINQLEDHYKTFITEQDFAQIAGAGLNWVRIPIGWWAIEVRDGEPFLPKVSWQYFLKAIQWARKYGLRINLDLHALPGSQNGWNHSGKSGTIGWLNGPMGYANAQRSLDYVRIIAEFISQPQYRDVVPMFGIINEPRGTVVGRDALSRFYFEAYQIVRNAGGTGEGNGPYVSLYDGFFPLESWNNFLPNADRVAFEIHPYMCFGGQSSNPISTYATAPCTIWGSMVNSSMGTIGLTTAGEFSNAVTDCGLFLNGVGLGNRYDATWKFDGPLPVQGSCTTWTDWRNYDDAMKAGLKQFALSSMDALQDYFFWTWKIGNSSDSGVVEAPAWSYQLGLENGWMPTDPREAIGACGGTSVWNPPLQPWQTGGAGAGNIQNTDAIAWPPATITNGGPIIGLPSYTPTGAIVTLPVPTFTATSGHSTKTADAGSGWQNNGDNAGMAVPIPTCSYLDPWVNPTTAPPSPLCAA